MGESVVVRGVWALCWHASRPIFISALLRWLLRKQIAGPRHFVLISIHGGQGQVPQEWLALMNKTNASRVLAEKKKKKKMCYTSFVQDFRLKLTVSKVNACKSNGRYSKRLRWSFIHSLSFWKLFARFFAAGPTVSAQGSVIIYAPPFPPEQNWFDSILIMLPLRNDFPDGA